MVFVIVAVLTAPVSAGALSGVELYQSCQDKKRGVGNIVCTAYIHGLVDGMTMGVASEKFPGKYCPPDSGISAPQARLIIEKFLRDHPERLHVEAGLVAGLAIIEAFPCATKSN